MSVGIAGSSPLRAGGELNKLAAHIALGRDIAGVHWRSDGIEGLKLGGPVALSLLRDLREPCTENSRGFWLTGFDSNALVVCEGVDRKASSGAGG
jgi:hypothetical protein